jgi:hypothetical protein
VLRRAIKDPQQATAMMRLFPHATNPAAPINWGVRADAAKGIAQGRIVETPQDVVVTYVIGIVLAGVNRAMDLPEGRVREFAEQLGAILLHGLSVKRGEAERIMREAGEPVLANGTEARV